MDATRILARLCARHGLPLAEAQPLLPLVERALVSPQDVRERLLALIETNLERRAGGAGEVSIEGIERDLDEEVLRAVARTLHGWEPSPRVSDLGAGPPSEPDGADDAPGPGGEEGPAQDDLGLPGGFGL